MALILPASVTPLTPDQGLDLAGLPRLRGWFDAAGCDGWVIAGTNGEGPSLSFYEKRELLAAALGLGKSAWSAPDRRFRTILGVAANAVEDAIATVRMATKAGADGVLLMPPAYFREAAWEGVEAWFGAVLAMAELPIYLYNLPARTGISLPPERLDALARFDSFAGLKDSSGRPENLVVYRTALPEKELFVGDERLLLVAVEAGWQGTISGVANVLPNWLKVASTDPVKFALIAPLLEELKAMPQPGTHKVLLHRSGILAHPTLKAPLIAGPDVGTLEHEIRARLGELA